MLTTNPFSEESQKYIEEARFSYYLKKDDLREFWLAISLMDAFIQWLEVQIETGKVECRDYNIIITGP